MVKKSIIHSDKKSITFKNFCNMILPENAPPLDNKLIGTHNVSVKTYSLMQKILQETKKKHNWAFIRI